MFRGFVFLNLRTVLKALFDVKTDMSILSLPDSQGVGHNDDKVLVLAATNTPYALDQVTKNLSNTILHCIQLCSKKGKSPLSHCLVL